MFDDLKMPRRSPHRSFSPSAAKSSAESSEGSKTVSAVTMPTLVKIPACSTLC